MESCLRSFRLPRCEHTLCQLCRGKRTCGDDFGALVPFQLDPARGSAQRACDWLWGGLVENLVQIVGTALDKRLPGLRCQCTCWKQNPVRTIDTYKSYSYR